MAVTTSWWDAFAEAGGLPDLETWLGGVDADSRVRVRQRIAESGYESVLDCGAGLAIDAIGMANLSHPCRYQGVEPSSAMREAAVKMAERFEVEPPDIVDGAIDSLPCEDSSFDLVYCRHVFEHLPRFEDALAEMIRVARLEALVVFFIRPGTETYLLRERDGLWHSRWAKAELDAYLRSDPRVEVWFYEGIHEEAILHVMLKAATEVTPALVADRLGR